MSRPIEQASYYTPPSVELVAARSNIGQETLIPSSKPFRKLTDNLLGAYSDTRVFHNGDPVASPRDRQHKIDFENTIRTVVWEKTSDLLTPEGNVKVERSQEWVNVLDIAPSLTAIILRNQKDQTDDIGTNGENYISGVNREAAANVAGIAIAIARNPALLSEMVIGTGFGGSDDAFTSTRLPAYMLPSLKMVGELQQFYAEREETAVSQATRNKVFESLLAKEKERTGQDMFEKSVRKTLNAEAAVIIQAHDEGLPTDIDPELLQVDDEEVAALREQFGIATDMPTARFFFGSQAAIAINHTMQPEGIRTRVAENRSIMEDFVTTYFPDIADNVQIVEDKPWSEHTPYQRTVIEYLAHVLRESDDPSIVSTLQTMERLGENHGGDNGSERSAEYAAIHPLIFGDRLNLPYASFVQGVPKNARINITIGGPTERKFTALRRYLTDNANPEGLQKFIETKKADTSDPDEQQQLARIAGLVNLWMSRVDGARDKIYTTEGPQPIRPDLPETTVELNTSIGALPTYYVREGDRAYGSDIGEQIDALCQPIDYNSVDPTEKLHARLVRENVVFDLKALRKELQT